MSKKLWFSIFGITQSIYNYDDKEISITIYLWNWLGLHIYTHQLTNTLCVAPFWVQHGFIDTGRRVSRKSIMEVPDKIISVVFWEGHECAAHHNELNLVHIMAELPQLETLIDLAEW